MTEEKKAPIIEFAPGCFDTFEGTQEELDELIAEIQSMFENKTADEIKSMSRPMSDEDFEDLPDDVKEQLFNISVEDNEIVNKTKRNLQ